LDIAKAPNKYIDVGAGANFQVERLVNIFKDIKVRYNKKFPTQIFIKNR